MKSISVRHLVSCAAFIILVSFASLPLSAYNWTKEIADGQGDVGYQSAIALDTNTHVVYSDGVKHTLKYARKDANGWSTETIPGTGGGLCSSSIALDESGNTHVSYIDTSGSTTFVKHAAEAGGVWTIENVETSSLIVFHTPSIAISLNGDIHISYRGGTQLKYAKKHSGSWATSVVDGGPPLNLDVGNWASIALDSTGKPRICYYNDTNKSLCYAAWTGSAWLKDTAVDLLDGAIWTSLAIGKNDIPHISYYSNKLRLMYTTYTSWGNWIRTGTGTGWGEVVDAQAFPGSTSIVVDANGIPHIAYQAGNSPNLELRYATRTGPNTWTYETVDQGGTGASVKIGITGTPAISHSYLAPSSNPTSILKYAYVTSSPKPCFIATAAYGSALDSHVNALRSFRDRVLMNNAVGRALVHLYESISPPLADFISRHENARIAARFALTPIVFAVVQPISFITIMEFIILGFVFLRIRFRKKTQGRFLNG